ncbi:Protein GET1 {ECO:0000255/HAMAP-Rule:MF_03113} AltName: Full=Guided entry of tail-anchored proteins 1 {ECO:0000255/HAMAP-Rule:MF_03113} [Serendipita indica DSM 11827]|uniref:Uncharacterized protein n=1 Tax=Serendipita indica (strain DSM 11827) TaxID=1109443 RepID=G4TKE9_SERID|nr:Protein GET1 {ECO:0000255/HAMAP-Rule:MF_03113} AltName: Full=Guided entry of tail-anchored proteins 1 {ECO:0000255/HAMAP-Rule:MF_03113} [Serendipita indica DSM 11827]CCA71792.1 hypothetical protein PIIN_05727 [Serendipita indica DSM 11827]
MALALSILLLVILTNVLAWIGHAVLLDAAYALYARIVDNAGFSEQKQLKASILELKYDLAHTSAQDEFAKWAKLRRRHDKAMADLEKLNTRLGASKSSFSSNFNWFLWFATTGAQFVLVWWYRREPVFFLPPGWLGPMGWFLSLPSAPSGSVSGAAWQMACQRVVKMGERFVKDLLEPSPEQAGPADASATNKTKQS